MTSIPYYNSIVGTQVQVSGQNVGIGTATPSYKLDVNGSGNFSSSVTATSLIKSGGTSSQFLKADGSVDGSTYAKSNGSVNHAAWFSTNGDDISYYGSDTKDNIYISTDMYFQSKYGMRFLTDAPAFPGAGTERLHLDTSEAVFNDGGNNYRFRIEGVSDTHLLFTDALENRVGIGTSTPAYKLDVAGSGNINTLKINDQYIFPTGLGSVGDSLVYAGSNQVAWSGVGGGGTDTNDYVDSISFNTSDGYLTLGRTGSLSNLEVNLDGRYLEAHPSTSPAFSSDNSGRTYIQDILLDSYGHVTGIATATETVTDTTYTDGSGLLLVGTTFHANVDSTTQSVAPNSVSSTASRTYAVQVDDSSDKLVVNVPWVDTDTNISLSGNLVGDLNLNNYDIVGTGNITIDGNITAEYFYGDLDGVVITECRNGTASTISEGTPVYVSGYYSSNGKPLIAEANAGSSSTMPAIGLLASDLASGAEGHVHVFGLAQNLPSAVTNGFSVGETVYVAAGGGLTNVRPTGVSELVQNMGRVLKTGTNGRILVLGPGRSNDVPNSGHFEQLTVDGQTILAKDGGSVGIGTATPSPAGGGTSLHIHDTNYPEIKLTNDNTGSTSDDGSVIQVVNSDLRFTNREDGQSISFYAFDTGGTSRQKLILSESLIAVNGAKTNTDFQVRGEVDDNLIRTDANTNRVGIGTATPQAKLDVNGTVQFDDLVRWEHPDKTLDTSTSTLGYMRLYDETGGYAGLGVSASNFNIGTSGAINLRFVVDAEDRMIFTTTGNNTLYYNAGQGLDLVKSTDSTDGLHFGDKAYSTSSAYQGIKHLGMTGSSDYMMISEGLHTLISAKATTGSVWIRGGGNYGANQIKVYPSTMPNGASIEIDGTNTSEIVVNQLSNNVDFRVEGDFDSHLLFTDASADSVGIGTALPTAKLEIADEITGSGTLLSLNGTSWGDGETTYLSWNRGGSYVANIGAELTGGATNAHIVFETAANAERMRITSSGNVGIGTNDPASTLTIASTNEEGLRIHTVSAPSQNFIIGRNTSNGTLVFKGSQSDFSGYEFRSTIGGSSQTVLQTDRLTGAITFNDEFTFPTTDGSAGQSLVTDGNGNVSWENILNQTVNGRLTLESDQPVSTTGQFAKTTLYFTPYKGNQVSVYNGTNWSVKTLSEISLSLSGYAADTNFDIFVYDNSGTLTLESVAWTNDTTRATALITQDGVYVKSGATTRRYLGTIRTTATTGQCEDSTIRRFVWNYYNREIRIMSGYLDEGGGSHTYSGGSWRAYNNSTSVTTSNGGTRVELVIGINSPIHFHVNAQNKYGFTGISYDTTTSITTNAVIHDGTNTGSGMRSTASDIYNLSAGFHYLQVVENSVLTNTATFYWLQHRSYLRG